MWPERLVRDHLGLVVALLGGLGLRLWILGSSIGGLDSDEAVTALMAEDFLGGEPRVFFWGQDYGGTLDSLVTAPVFAVTGPSVVGAKLVMVVCHAIACVLLWRIGRRLFDDRVGLLAAATAWVMSAGVVWFSTKTRGFYGASIVLGLLVVLIVLRLADREPGRPVRVRPTSSVLRDMDADARDLASLGLVVGLAWWVSPIVFFLAGPALLYGLVVRSDLLRRIGWAVPGFVVGALPWLVLNLARGFPSLDQPSAAVESTYLDRLEGFVTRLVPTLLGVRAPYSGAWLGGRVVGIVLAFVIGLILLILAVRIGRRSWLPLVVLLGYGLAFAVPAATEYVAEPRYGYLLAPMLALVAGYGLARLGRSGQLVPVVVLVATTIGVVGLRDWGRENPGSWDLDPPPVDVLAEALGELGVDAVYADYWIAYRLGFETDVLASPIDHVRNQELADRVAARQTSVFVYYDGSALEQAQLSALAADGVPVRTTVVGPYLIAEVGEG